MRMHNVYFTYALCKVFMYKEFYVREIKVYFMEGISSVQIIYGEIRAYFMERISSFVC